MDAVLARLDALLAHLTAMVTTPSDREIAMTRTFSARRQLVFEALTTPELLKRWLLGPAGWSMTECQIDPRSGGVYRFAWRHADGHAMGVRGVCLDVVPLERIVATERVDQPWYPGEALLTESLAERRGRTTLTLTMRYDSREIRNRVLRTPMAASLWTTYDRLAYLLAARTSDTSDVSR
jgi:uncharacterized protein YndB with AHSA1/START domain